MLDVEELQQSVDVCDTAGCLYSLVGVLFERCLDGLAERCSAVAPNVGSIEVSDKATSAGEVLSCIVVGVNGSLVLEVFADERRVDLDFDAEAFKYAEVLLVVTDRN